MPYFLEISRESSNRCLGSLTEDVSLNDLRNSLKKVPILPRLFLCLGISAGKTIQVKAGKVKPISLHNEFILLPLEEA